MMTLTNSSMLAKCNDLLTVFFLSSPSPPLSPHFFPPRPSTDVTVRSALGKSHFSDCVVVLLGRMNMQSVSGRGGPALRYCLLTGVRKCSANPRPNPLLPPRCAREFVALCGSGKKCAGRPPFQYYVNESETSQIVQRQRRQC